MGKDISPEVRYELDIVENFVIFIFLSAFFPLSLLSRVLERQLHSMYIDFR